MQVRHLPTVAEADRFAGDNFPFMRDDEWNEEWNLSVFSPIWAIFNRKHQVWMPCPVGSWVIRRAPGDCYVVDAVSFAELWEATNG